MKHLAWMTCAVICLGAGVEGSAQVKQGAWTPVVESMDRGYSSISYWTYRDDGVEIGGGRISVEHGKPRWPEAMDQERLDEATIGKLWRLGNNKWTTLDTQLPLRMGDREVTPGIYYLVIRRPAAEQWELAFVQPRTVVRDLVDAWAAQARPEEISIAFTVPLEYRRTTHSAVLDMSLRLDREDMSKGVLRIQWGPHQLETGFDIRMVSPEFYK